MNEKAKKVADPKPVTTPTEITEVPERDTFFDLHIGEVYLDTKKGGERFSLSIEGGINVYYQKDAEDDEQPTSLKKEDVEDALMGVLNKIIPTKPTPQPARVVTTFTSEPTPMPAQPTPVQQPTKPATTETQETVSRDEYKKLVNSMYGMQNAISELMKVVEKLSSSNK